MNIQQNQVHTLGLIPLAENLFGGQFYYLADNLLFGELFTVDFFFHGQLFVIFIYFVNILVGTKTRNGTPEPEQNLKPATERNSIFCIKTHNRHHFFFVFYSLY